MRSKLKSKSAFKLFLPFAWLSSTVLTVFVVALLLITSNSPNTGSKKYSIFSAKPLVLGYATSRLESEDGRSAMLDKVFEQYKCPLAGMGKTFVQEADANDIPYWLVAAIAFQESSCGKNTPEKDGVESYNAWGWGVYGENIKMFDSWEHGIKVVSKYMNERFHQQGVTDPCDIMKIYTPPSNGSWCNGVNYFSDIISNYKTPEN